MNPRFPRGRLPVSLFFAGCFVALLAVGSTQFASAAEPTPETKPAPVPKPVPTAEAAAATAAAAARNAAASAPSTGTPGMPPAAPGFESIDLPDWALLDAPPRQRKQPWILVIDDPQCPYCMQLHLALIKVRESGDKAIAGALLARFPFPLPIHDQAAHIVTDALCLEASRDRRGWNGAAYLDWLMLDGWKDEPGLKTATLDDLEKDGGLFDSKYDAHRVTSSRRREYQNIFIRKESECAPDGCHGDSDCEKLCAKESECRKACPAADAAPAAGAPGGGGSSAPAAGAKGQPPSAEPAPSRTECLDDCDGAFRSARYRMLAREHSACVLEEGPDSAHGRTAAAFQWAIDHDIPGTPTVYVGHPLIGWRLIGDADDLEGFIKLLRPALTDARAALDKALVLRPEEKRP